MRRVPEILFREDGSLEPRQRVVISRTRFYKLIGTSPSPFIREVKTPGLYTPQYTESGMVRIYGGEINYLKGVIVKKRVAREIGSVTYHP